MAVTKLTSNTLRTHCEGISNGFTKYLELPLREINTFHIGGRHADTVRRHGAERDNLPKRLSASGGSQNLGSSHV